jgi:hypothetical protein
MVEDGWLNKNYIGRKGLFLLKRTDGGIEAYNGIVLFINETHIRIQLRDGKETDLLRTDIQKVEWQNGGKV